MPKKCLNPLPYPFSLSVLIASISACILCIAVSISALFSACCNRRRSARFTSPSRVAIRSCCCSTMPGRRASTRITSGGRASGGVTSTASMVGGW